MGWALFVILHQFNRGTINFDKSYRNLSLGLLGAIRIFCPSIAGDRSSITKAT